MGLVDLTKVSRQSIHFWVYFACLCLLAAAIPTSRFMISVSQILLGINWLIEARFKEKFHRFFSNKPAVVFVLIYIMHIIGLAWSEDLNYGLMEDLRHKLPTLTLTLMIVSSRPIDLKKLHLLIGLFISAVLVVSFIGMFVYITKDLTDFRDIIPFGSHLYYGMMLIMAVFMLPWLVKQLTFDKRWHYLAYLASIWMVFFLFVLRSLSGIASLIGVVAFLIIYIVYNNKSMLVKLTAIILFLLSLILSLWLFINMYNIAFDEVETDFSKLEQYTKYGNEYEHDTTSIFRENGHLVYLYISDEELEEVWNERSDINFYDIDRSQSRVRYTLYRYMASKGYRKDKEHFELLSDEEINAIEQGVTNYHYVNWPGIFTRIHQTMAGIYVYNKSNNPFWSTLTQRIDLWKASLVAFKKNPIIGWGTGDIFLAVEYGLEKNDSKMKGRMMKPHSQYLLFLLTLGSLGLIMFLAFYTYTVFKTKAYRNFVFNIFLITFFVNMIANNPIDDQIGQAMFTFFTIFFCFMYPSAKKVE